MKAMPVFCGVVLSLWGPLVCLALFPGNITPATGYVVAWTAVFLGGACGGRATESDSFIPALITGLWAGALAVFFSPARQGLSSCLSTVAVYGFIAVLGARVLNRERRSSI